MIFQGKTNFAVRPKYANLCGNKSDNTKLYLQSPLRSGEIAKKQNVGYPPTPLGHLSVNLKQKVTLLFNYFQPKTKDSSNIFFLLTNQLFHQNTHYF